MNTLRTVLGQLVGLFVDDGTLAVQIAAVVVLTGIATTLAPAVPLVAGGILLFGCLGVLFANVVRAAGNGRRPTALRR